ncbi:MAG: hypothetical protein IT433_13095 [Phycisphaerales bacterium]|nr:hypothetical protein [Phycisphaerales bacterium]
MTRDRRIQIMAMLVMLGALTGSVVMAITLTAQAGRSRITFTDRVEEGAPPEVSLGIAMGAFRGVFVNYLWIRANVMKEDGKFFESIQLADAITRLQPRFPRVWVFHAWNLAYNISVSTQTREERWEWVNAGIRLLRDKGIPANPNDMLLHKELGWFYLHKIGGFTDDANPYYKQQLAKEWTIVLGPPPRRGPEDRDDAVIIKKYADKLIAIRDAPETREELLAKVPRVAVLTEGLMKAGVKNDYELLQRYEMWAAGKQSGQRALWESAAGEKTKAFGVLADDPANAEAWPALLNFLRKRMLVDVYHMEPERMVRFTQTYGPLDWRHHGAHALYWSARGVEVGEARATADNLRDYDFINTDRVVVQSLQDLYRSGDLYFDFFSSMFPDRNPVWKGAPNVHFVDAYGRALDPMRQRSGIFNDLSMRGTTSLSTGFENFLRDVVCFYYARGDRANAEKYRDILLNHPALNIDGRFRFYEDTGSIDDFVAKELQEEWSRPAIAILQVEGALQGAYTSGLLAGDGELFRNQMNYAKIVHRLFFEAQSRFTGVDPNNERMRQLPKDFRVLAGISLTEFMSGLDLDDAERVYDGAPDDLRGFAYDFLADRYKASLDDLYTKAKDQGARPFDAIFPRPDSLESARAAVQAYIESVNKPDVKMETR